jgi:hypothetical protein
MDFLVVASVKVRRACGAGGRIFFLELRAATLIVFGQVFSILQPSKDST